MFNTSSFNCLLKTTYIPLVSSPFASLVTSRWPLKLKLRLCSKRGSPGAKTSPPSPVPVEPKAPPLEDPRAGVPNPPVRLGVPNPVVAPNPWLLKRWSRKVFQMWSLTLDWYYRVLWWCQMDFPETLFLLSPKNLLNRQGLSENCQSLR